MENSVDQFGANKPITSLVKKSAGKATPLPVPRMIGAAGPDATRRFLEFFTATIRNRNTRIAYGRAVGNFFAWCKERGLSDLHQIEPIVVAAYVEDLGTRRAKPTVKQHLAAIRMLFDWLVTGHILETNPAAAVRGPSHVVHRGRTPILCAQETRQLLDSIPIDGPRRIVGLRDRALIGTMVFSFARVSAVTGMLVEDFYQERRRWWFRLQEKGGKQHHVPAHHKAEEYLHAYLDAAGLRNLGASPLFQSVDCHGQLTGRPLHRTDVLAMVKRRAKRAGLPPTVTCHTFRATGITAYLENGGTLENAQAIANHSSPRTTKLYDRTGDEITLDEIERIVI